jgi:hypothetical protein
MRVGRRWTRAALLIALAGGARTALADPGVSAAPRPAERFGLTLSFRPAPGQGGLPTMHESWRLLEPLMPLPPSYLPSAESRLLGPSAANVARLGAGAAGLIEAALGRVGVEGPDRVSLFYAGPLGARAERGFLVGRVPTSFSVIGQYDLGDERVGPGWTLRFTVSPRF